MKDSIKNALLWRYAVTEFDTQKPLDDETFEFILESGRLSPSSNGFEPWKFIVVDDPAIRQKIRDAANSQPKVTEAAKLVVLAYRTDAPKVISEIVARQAAAQGQPVEALAGYGTYLTNAIASEADVERYFEKQVYIPLGIMLQTAALLHVDAGPMSGFSPAKVDEILDLREKGLKSTVLLALGYRKSDPARPKVRQSTDEAILHVA
jgi:nitroreductase / dihydropteridine reductase